MSAHRAAPRHRQDPTLADRAADAAGLGVAIILAASVAFVVAAGLVIAAARAVGAL